MVSNLIYKLKWSFRKNYPDLRGLFSFEYPNFVFLRNPSALKDEIPVFTFHSVEPKSFEEKLKFLKENDYYTLNSEEFYQCLTKNQHIQKNSILLTFDDGAASLWGIAFPLLKKYSFRAVSFIIPGCIHEDTQTYPNLEDVWSGKVTLEEIMQRESGSNSLCNWQEIKIMHKSGIIDFQSHSMYHHLICVSPKLVDFIHPGYNFYFFANINAPVYRTNGKDNNLRNLRLGTPIYESEPRMSTKPRYLDNELVRQNCVEFVDNHGSKEFFHKSNWRKILKVEHKRLVSTLSQDLRFENQDKQAENIYTDLHYSKKMVDTKLPGKEVLHFCYPWYMGSYLSVKLSKKAGYLTNFWGIGKGRNIIKPGDDPYYLSRIDERYLLRLPGKGRKSLKEILFTQISENLHGFLKNLKFN